MDRNNELPEVVRYSYGYPPSSVMDARSRLDDIVLEQGSIRGDLAAKNESYFRDVSSFQKWKVTANRALACSEREQAFILQWLSFEEGRLVGGFEKLSHEGRRDRLHGMVSEFLKTAPKPGKPIQETDVVTANDLAFRRERLVYINTLHAQFLTYLNGEAARMHCPDDYYRQARAKVSSVVQTVTAEIILIKSLLKRLPQPSGSRSSYDSQTQSNGNPNLFEINTSIHEVKEELRMNSADITIWFYDLVSSQRNALTLTDEQVTTLELISKFVELTKRRKAIELPYK